MHPLYRTVATDSPLVCPGAGQVVGLYSDDAPESECPVCGARVTLRRWVDRHSGRHLARYPVHDREDLRRARAARDAAARSTLRAEVSLERARSAMLLGEPAARARYANAVKLAETAPPKSSTARRRRELRRIAQEGGYRQHAVPIPSDPRRAARVLFDAAGIDPGAIEYDGWPEHLAMDSALGKGSLRALRALIEGTSRKGREGAVLAGAAMLIRQRRARYWHDLWTVRSGDKATVLDVINSYPPIAEAGGVRPPARALDAEAREAEADYYDRVAAEQGVAGAGDEEEVPF